MPIAKTDMLLDLVNSLDKAEKRHFKIYCSRLGDPKNMLFLKLYDMLSSNYSVDDNTLMRKLNIKSVQFINTKRHLYEQILKSLRILHSKKELILSLKEQFDFANILYYKGLHKQCFQLLNKLKPLVKNLNENILLLEILELQKRIESRHITRSRRIKNKMENLIQETQQTQNLISSISDLSNFSLNIQGLYIKLGFAKSERDLELIKVYFESNKPSLNLKDADIYERVYWHLSHIWYHYFNLKFRFCYKHAVSWVLALDNEPSLKEKDPGLYLRGMHYLLTHVFHLERKDVYKKWFNHMIDFRKKHLTNYKETTRMLDFGYYQNAILNSYILFNKYSNLEKSVDEITNFYEQYSEKIDIHRMHMFYYKIAICYSYIGRYEKAIDFINKILTEKAEMLRKDLKVYSRLLLIMCHFRLNNFTLVDNLIDSIKNEFISLKQWNKAVDLVLQFLRKASRAMNFAMDQDIIRLQERIDDVKQLQFDKAAFVYYDYNTWCESLLKNTTVEKVKRI